MDIVDKSKTSVHAHPVLMQTRMTEGGRTKKAALYNNNLHSCVSV